MYLQKISLINFKNFRQANISFSQNINCIVGNNGAGKTNLLDAIHYLCFCKSYFNPLDSQNILYGAEFFVIHGSFIKDDKTENICCSLKRDQRKQFKRNNKEYSRLADHIGLFPIVIISPEDHNLITQGSEIRRKFIDTIISQLDKLYLNDLINYNKAVAQRNSLLKQFADNRKFNGDALKVWNIQMIELGNRIHNKRLEFIKPFIPIFQKYYEFITQGNEKVSINYQSQLNESDFEKLLDDSLDKDRILQYSTAGVHKDDMVFEISPSPTPRPGSEEEPAHRQTSPSTNSPFPNLSTEEQRQGRGEPMHKISPFISEDVRRWTVKKFGSQGQQKSFLVALKLAQFDFIKSYKQFNPILLLDDIFDKLDANRVQKLIELVSNENFGQIFITHTHPERINKILKDINSEYNVYKIEKGMVDNFNNKF